MAGGPSITAKRGEADFHEAFLQCCLEAPLGIMSGAHFSTPRGLVVVVLAVDPFPVSSLLLNFYVLCLMPRCKRGKKRRCKRKHVPCAEAVAPRKASRSSVLSSYFARLLHATLCAEVAGQRLPPIRVDHRVFGKG